MFLTSALIVGGALYAGAKVYRKLKKAKPLGVLLAKQDMTKKESPFQTVLTNGQAALVKAIPTSLQPLFDNSHSAQLQDIPRDEDELTEQDLNHFLKVSTAAIGLDFAGLLIYAPLGLLSVPLIAYTFIPVFYSAYESIFKKRRFQTEIIDAIALLGIVAAGYWIIAAVGCWLYFITEKLRIKTAYQSRQNMVSLLDQQQQFVWQRVDGAELQTPLEALQVGDVIVVKVGEMIPVDGRIVDGAASIDQHGLNGDTQLAEKTVGEPVFAATVVLAGRIGIQVEKSGTDTLAAQMGDIFHRSADSKAARQTRADAISNRAALPMFCVCTLALATLGPVSAVAVLCSNFVENLRLAAPISLLNFLNLASRRGILIKAGGYLEQLGNVDTIVLDQTGPWRLGSPHVQRVSPYASMTETALLTYAAAAAYKQSSPSAKAIIQAAEAQNLALPDIDELLCEVDDGITIRLGQQVIQVGSARFLALEGITMPEEMQALPAASQARGHSLVYVALDDCLGGVIELQPTIGPETTAMMSQLKQRNLSIYVISNAHDTLTQELATALDIDHYVAEGLAEEKVKLVEQLQQEGRSVCFVGDGIYDVMAMQKAEASISLRGASTMVTDTAQMIITDQSLDQLGTLFDLAHSCKTNMQNTFATTLGLGVVGIGGIFLLHFGIVSAIIIDIVGLGAGMTSAMLPAFNRQYETADKTS